ncbi:MAG TPA: hypothetical protein VGS19_33870 [Streptosporangiaceae bacterium]|nr:hypothetical protein [Streptosporangiaceae bacterium]
MRRAHFASVVLGATAAALTLAMPAAAVAAPRGQVPGHTTGPVVVVGVGGLRWTDVSATLTPVLWRLAGQGSVGSLVVSGIEQRTCPADGWLTLNGAARVAVPPLAQAGTCPSVPAVVPAAPQAASRPGPASVPQMARLEPYNAQFDTNPQWGLLGSAPGAGRCVTAVGRGGALALANRNGQVARYLPTAAGLSRAVLGHCPLTVVDLGSLPTGSAGPRSLRAAALRADDRELGVIRAGLPADATLVVTAPGDLVSPHLRVAVLDGPRYRAGLLGTASTRQPGVVQLTDLTPTVLGWFGTHVPSAVVGSPLRSLPRGPLPATVRMLVAQDTGAQVYRDTVAPFYQLVGFGYPALFALIWVLPWGRGEEPRKRRRAVVRAVGVWAASVPAGTFLASLVPWWTLPHPAAVLYVSAAAWAVVVAVVALTGPWRRDPMGPPGVVGAVTLGVIGLDMMTGSRLALETPFGLSLLEAGRFYGLGNNGVAIYGASGILCAAWLGGVALRQGSRARALAAMAAVAAFAVIAAGWPGFGAKVGGTIAIVPALLILMAVAAGIRLTRPRLLVIAGSGVALVVAFALINYFLPAVTGQSDLGGFVGQALHGGAHGIVARKASSNLHSLTANPFIPVIPLVLVVAGLLIAWPARFRATALVRAYAEVRLLRVTLAAIWLVGVLGWFVEDSGVTVPAAGLPLVLPVALVILASVPAGGGEPQPLHDPAILDVR